MHTGIPDHRPCLIADIGGTHVRFALCTTVDDIGTPSIVNRAEFPSLEQAIRHYLDASGHPDVRRAVIGIANPVLGDHIKMTNSPWEFSIEATRQALGLARLDVINDFTALALALPHLRASDLVQVGGQPGVPDTPLGLLGPGTGLGVSALVPVPGGGWTALAAEGGHANFAPCNERETSLWREAHRKFGHVSMERLVSGPGLQFIYRSLCALDAVPAQDYTATQISTLAIDQHCPQCREALDIFCAVLGTAASDLALILGARGGIYIGGGIVPDFVDYFARSPFRARFEDKGRFSSYLAAVPVFVITSANPGLVGAAAYLQAFPDPD